MPYIPQDRRDKLDCHLPSVAWEIDIDAVGELNYAITRLVDEFLDDGKRTTPADGPGYAAYNAAIGVLECAKLELYRRLVAPYEDTKRLENGDVFHYTEDTKERNESE